MMRSFLDDFMGQQWGDLLLLHWPVSIDVIKPTIPESLELDLFEGEAWASVVGFHLSNLRIKPIRWFPWGKFHEVNLRTYVRDKHGRSGVWFHSLDSTDLFAVLGARVLYGLNYRWAGISQSKEENSISYKSCTRNFDEKIPAEINAELKNPKNQATIASEPIDQFLLERYRFWAKRKWVNATSSANVRHRPYDATRIQNARYHGKLFRSQNMPEPEKFPILAHFCRGFSVKASAPSWIYKIAGHANQR